jgi:hypothetical protein
LHGQACTVAPLLPVLFHRLDLMARHGAVEQNFAAAAALSGTEGTLHLFF